MIEIALLVCKVAGGILAVVLASFLLWCGFTSGNDDNE